MARKYARGIKAWGECQRCGKRLKLQDMLFDEQIPELRVCSECKDPKHPQDFLQALDDPVALWRPAPENLRAPTAPVLTAEIDGIDGQLDWTASESDVSQISRYELYRSASSVGGGFELLTTKLVERDMFGAITNDTTGRSYLDTDTDFTVDYYLYYVIAYAVQGGSAQSNTVPLATPPSPPVLTLEIVDADDGIYDLSWTASTAPVVSVSGYSLYRSIDHGDYELLTTTAANVLEYTDTGVLNFLHRYDYYVVANSSLVGIDSLASNIVTVHRIQNAIVLLSNNGGSKGLISRESGLWESFDCPAHSCETGVFVSDFDSDGGLFVAVGPQNSMISRDGTTWTRTVLNPLNTLTGRQQIAWSPTLRLFVWATTLFIATSPDGVTWTTRTIPAPGGTPMQPVCVIWYAAAALFIIGSQTGGSNAIATSPDAINWTSRSTPQTCFALAANGIRIVGVDGNDNKSFTSDDGLTYVGPVTNPSGGFQNLDFGNGVFAAISAGGLGRGIVSSNGDAWTSAVSVGAGDWTRVVFATARARFYSAGGNSQGNNLQLVNSSANGSTWTKETTPPEAETGNWSAIMPGFAQVD